MLQTLRQTMEVTTDHELHFDIKLPETFPIGQVEVVLVVASQQTKDQRKIELEKLAGSLKESANFGNNPLTLQRKLRDEWQN